MVHLPYYDTKKKRLVWWSMPLILVLQRKRLTQVGLCESEASLAYTVIPDQLVI